MFQKCFAIKRREIKKNIGSTYPYITTIDILLVKFGFNQAI